MEKMLVLMSYFFFVVLLILLTHMPLLFEKENNSSVITGPAQTSVGFNSAHPVEMSESDGLKA